MKAASAAVLICASSIFACDAPDPASPPATATVIGKCAFTGRTTPEIEPGDVFLYALRDDRNGNLGVVTGVASTKDSLLDAEVRQPADDILPARLREPARLEFGGLAIDGTGDAEYYVSMGFRPGEVFTSIGATFGTEIAYPTCVFHE